MEQETVTKAVRKLLTGRKWRTFAELEAATGAPSWQIKDALHELYEERGFDLDSDLARRTQSSHRVTIYYRINKEK